MNFSPSLTVRILLVGFALLAFIYSLLPAILARYLFVYGLYENGSPIW